MNRWLATVALAVLAASCLGGLANEPFAQGTGRVEGTLLGTLGAAPWVCVAEHPEISSIPDSAGAFVLVGVPTGTRGEAELMASDGNGGALRMVVRVFNRQTTRVELRPSATSAARVEGQVSLQGPHGAERSSITIEGLPVQAVAAASGRFTLESLPTGCFVLGAEHALHARAQTTLCLHGGETLAVNLFLLRTPDAVAWCAPCGDDSSCGGGRCVTHRLGDIPEQVCGQLCEEDDHCPTGFDCQGVEGSDTRVCLPHRGSCSARQAFSAEQVCAGDDDCGLPGAEDGLCRASRCTLRCDNEGDCPGGAVCVADSGGKRCQHGSAGRDAGRGDGGVARADAAGAKRDAGQQQTDAGQGRVDAGEDAVDASHAQDDASEDDAAEPDANEDDAS